MSNRVKPRNQKRIEVAERLKERICPKCAGLMSSKEYSDATLYICRMCSFPIRVKKRSKR